MEPFLKGIRSTFLKPLVGSRRTVLTRATISAPGSWWCRFLEIKTPWVRYVWSAKVGGAAGVTFAADKRAAETPPSRANCTVVFCRGTKLTILVKKTRDIISFAVLK